MVAVGTDDDARFCMPVQWRLQVCMAHAGIRFASDLHRRLVAVLGKDRAPSESQVSRLGATGPNG